MTNTTSENVNRQADDLRNKINETANQAKQTGERVMNQARNVGQEALSRGNNPQSSPTPEHREGRIARTIEQQTAKLPSDAFLWAAFGAIGASLIFQISGKEHKANFVGQWAPTFLVLGLYNKMVKLMGSDAV